MNYSEIMGLLDKGFTPNQIMTLTGGQATPAAETPEDGGKDVDNPKEEPAAVETPTPEPADNPQPEVIKEVSGMITQLKELRDQMESMKKEFQKEAILTDAINTPTQVSADDALAELIRPKYNNDTK